MKKEVRNKIEKDISETYNKLIRKLKKSEFVEYKNTDLHVHTPASHDYVYANPSNTEIVEYELLLEKFASSDIDVIAITDHNNINGYEKIVSILENDKTLASKLAKKLILPGIEIDCYGSHFLTIFDNDLDIEKIKGFIYNCGLINKDTNNQSADRVTPLLLCEEVYKLNGVVILAHADTTKGFLQSYYKNTSSAVKRDDLTVTGQTIQTVLKCKSLLGVSINSKSNIQNTEDLLHNWKIENCKIIQSSDSHSSLDNYEGSGTPFGTRNSWIKMSALSYKSLIMSLRQENSKILFEQPINTKEIFIKGIATKGGFLVNSNMHEEEYAIFPFSSELNCLIGARGTGKSTLIEIIDYIFNFENYYDEEIKREDYQATLDYLLPPLFANNYVINRYREAIIYINCKDSLYAIYSNPRGFRTPNISIFAFKKNKFILKCHCNKISNKSLSQFIKIREKFKVKVYKQKDLLEMTSDKMGVTKLIDALNTVGLGYKYLEYKIILKKYNSEIREICKKMFYERKLDKNADWNNDNLKKKYTEYYKIYNEYIALVEDSLHLLNSNLKGKLHLNYKIEFEQKLLWEIVDDISSRYEKDSGNNYQVKRDMQKELYYFISTNIKKCPDMLYHIFTHNHKTILNKLDLKGNEKFLENLVEPIWKYISQDYAPLLPGFIIDFDLNVNYKIKSKEHYVEREQLSFGQKTVGALLMIMHGASKLGDKLPLIIDQPEDDLDNSYVYHMLVKQFWEVKENKQLLIATHNPNIPVCGEAENILVMESNGEKGWISCYGTVDNSSVSKSVLRILEGDFNAFKKRAEVYGFELINLPKTKP